MLAYEAKMGLGEDHDDEARAWPRAPFLIFWLYGCAAAGLLYHLIAMGLSEGPGMALLSLVIIPFGLVLPALGALIAAVPLLLLTAALRLLGEFWRPAQSWPLWAGTAAAAALVTGPWLDSGFVDPLPDLRDTAAVVIPAIGGASTTWALLRERPMRPLEAWRSVVVASVLALILVSAALDWRSRYARAHVHEVRSARGQTFRPSDDHVAAPVTLLEYPEPRGASRYWTSGRSLTFRLAPATLRPRPVGNGPLRELNIHAQRRDFAPLNARPDLRQDDIDLALRSAGAFHRDYGASAHDNLSRNPNNALGTMCGLRFVYDGYSPDEREAIRRGWPASYAVLKQRVGAFVENPSDAATGATCGSARCVISFRYRGFAGNYRLDSKDICRWPQETARVVAFLDRQLIGQTPPRPKPQPVDPGDGVVIEPLGRFQSLDAVRFPPPPAVRERQSGRQKRKGD